MKYLQIITLTLLSAACACVISCATWSKLGTPENIERVTYEAVYRIGAHIPFNKQATVHAQAYAAAAAIRSFETGGRLPTGAQIEAVILLYTDKGSIWAEIAHDVAFGYDVASPHFGSGVAQGFAILEAMARGIEKWALLPIPLPFETPKPGKM